MNNNYKREYHPPHRNILSTFKTKTYSTYVQAIDEFIDNSIDSILRAHMYNKDIKQFKIVLVKKGDDLIIMDNGHGAVNSEIKDVVILGSSGTKKHKTPSAHGTFGAGATSAALYLVNSENSCNLTAVSYRGAEATLAVFDLEDQEEDSEPWGYSFCYDPNDSEDFQEKLLFLKEKTKSRSDSGMAIFIENGTKHFPSSTSGAWETISKSIKINYAKKFKDLSESNVEIEFEFYSDGSNGERKSEKSSFNTKDGQIDVLNYSPNPDLITWYVGGANHQYEVYNICGIPCGIRASQFLDYVSRDKTDVWGTGYSRSGAQGVGFIRHGKRTECSTTKGWVFDPHKRSVLVELEYNGDYHPHLKVNQEKTEVILSDEFQKELTNILSEFIQTAKEACLAKGSIEKLDDVELDYLAEGIATTFASERKSKTDVSKTLVSVNEFSEPKTKRQNETYVGKTEDIKMSSSARKTILPGFEIEEDYSRRYLPFYRRLDNTQNPPKSVLVANQSHPFTKALVEHGLYDELFTAAASYLFGPRTHGKSQEEIYEEVEIFGETYIQVTKASAEAKKKKLKIVS